MKKIFISIVNYNGTDNTNTCLEQLEKLHVLDFTFSIIVVDNASREPFTYYKKSKHEVILLQNKENLGFSGGHNTGIQYALEQGADYVLVLNDDVLIDSDLLHELLIAAEKDKQIGIAVPKIYFAKGHEFHKDRYTAVELGKVFWYAGGEMDWSTGMGKHRGVDEVDKGQYDQEEETSFATGCCMLVKREVFEKVGMLDERYFLYFEDSDFSERVKHKGFKIVYTPKAILWHINAGSTGGSGSVLQDYFITRNRLLFNMRYAPLRLKIALIRESMRILKSGREWQKKGVQDFYLHKLGIGSYHV